MHRQPSKKNKTYLLTIMTIITIAVLTSLVFILTIGAKDIEEQKESDNTEKIVIKSPKVASTKSSNLSPKYSISSESKDNYSYTSDTVQITDLSQYTNLNGNYIAGNDKACSINFEQKKFLLYYAMGKKQTYNFSKVLLHPDNSLVINAVGYHEKLQQNGEYVTEKTEISVLLAPNGTFVRRNWQTGDEINDVTDKDAYRIAIAYSNDHGRTYNMTPAYRAFETNGFDSDKKQHSPIYIRSND